MPGEGVYSLGELAVRVGLELRGDPAKLTAATGWEPRIAFEQTFADTIEWWERELSGPGVRH